MLKLKSDLRSLNSKCLSAERRHLISQESTCFQKGKLWPWKPWARAVCSPDKLYYFFIAFAYKEKRLYLVFAGYFWCKLYNSRLLWLRGEVGGQFPRNVWSLFWEEPWPDFSSTGKWRLLFLYKCPRDTMSENNCRGQWRCNSTGHMYDIKRLVWLCCWHS